MQMTKKESNLYYSMQSMQRFRFNQQLSQSKTWI